MNDILLTELLYFSSINQDLSFELCVFFSSSTGVTYSTPYEKIENNNVSKVKNKLKLVT